MKYAAFLVAGFLLCACTGGGQPVSPSSSASAGAARFTIQLPAPTASAGRAPKYISAATHSIAVAVNGGAPAVTALSATSPACAPSQTATVRTSAGFALSCTINVSAPVGDDTFAVSIYASANGSGTALASHTLTAPISQGQTTPLNLTLDGVVSSVSLSISDQAPVEGTPETITLFVQAKDASGATIIGPGNFTQPITISDSDTTGATQLSASTVTSPVPGTVTVTYTGAHVTATFTATAPGAIDAAIAHLSSHANMQTLWVANSQGNTVTAYTGPGNVSPVTTISGLSSEPLCQAFDAQGNLWIVTSPGSKQAGAIDEVPAAAVASGTVTAIAGVIRGASTQIVNAVGCAFDKSGNLWLANDDNYNDSLIAFSPKQLAGGGGDVSPAIIVNPTNNCCYGSNGSLCNTVGLAFDTSGNLWVSNLCTNAVEYAASSLASGGPVSPVAWFSQAFGPNALAFDRNGNLWTTGNDSATMLTAASLAGARNNVSASLTIAGADTQMNAPFGIAFDSAGDMAVSQSGSNAVTVYSAASLSAGGDVAPTQTLSGSNTGLSGPLNMVFASGVPTVRATPTVRR